MAHSTCTIKVVRRCRHPCAAYSQVLGCPNAPILPTHPFFPAGAQRSPAFAKVSGAMARPSMWAGACLGALAGFMLAYQNSCGRLMGLKVS